MAGSVQSGNGFDLMEEGQQQQQLTLKHTADSILTDTKHAAVHTGT